MTNPSQRETQTPDSHSVVRNRDPAARMAGTLLLLTALATLVAVFGRVAADADQPTLPESLAAISLSSGLYGLGGAARLVSGITLAAGAWYLTRTWIIRERLGTPLAPILFAISGVFTAISGAGAVILVASAPDVTALTETSAYLRWITGKIGFAFAGLALIVAARYQWKVGGALRYIAPVSAVLGIAMQFIWIDAATVVHRITGPAFLIWLAVIGAMLFTGRVEQHFIAALDSKRR